MNFRILLILVVFVVVANVPNNANATTYTCTKVEDKATLAYDGSDTVTDNHSDGKCSWSIGSATCTGCYQVPDFEANAVHWQERIEGLRRLAYGDGYDVRIDRHFPALRAAVYEQLDTDIGDTNLGDVRCNTTSASYGELDFDFSRPGYSDVEIGCAIYEYDPYYEDRSFRVGDTEIHPTGSMIIISVKGGWNGQQVTTYARVPR